MRRRRTVLLLQLPALDNAVRGPRENVPLAGIYLQQALAASGESAHFRCRFAPPEAELLDNAGLVRLILRLRPAVLACTLYLWNVERTLRVARALRRDLPRLQVVVGGPEVFRTHPFLLRAGVAEAAVVGEGEHVFAGILRGLRTGRAPDFTTVAWRSGRGYAWGRREPPPVSLADFEPWPAAEGLNPGPAGVAYLETTRGCPMCCSFCRYHHLRPRMDWLPPEEVGRRVRGLRRRGAREIRFTDPTFNAHPRFEEAVAQIAAANPRPAVKLYAELRADTLSARGVALLAAAHFKEVEVGLQSRDPRVLQAVRRPTDLGALEAGVRSLTRRGLRVTLDVMHGLPGQTARDVYASIRWARRFRRVKVQCMQTLLLPGTELRRRARGWKLEAERLPPYGVVSTASLPREEIRGIEAFIAATPGLPADTPTARFAGWSLPDLFAERCRLDRRGAPWPGAVAGVQNRRALLFRGADLFGAREAIRAAIRGAIRQEPDILWQFVLAPRAEEPLDLLDALAAEIQAQPRHLLDRYGGLPLSGRLAARRLLVLLQRGRSYARAWVAAAERLLRSYFY